MTPEEYRLLMKAERYRQVDEQHLIHELAYLTFVATARKGKKQKPVYGRFERFYDYDKELKKLEGGNEKLKNLSKELERQRREATRNGKLQR